jgi:hypothetical protein
VLLPISVPVPASAGVIKNDLASAAGTAILAASTDIQDGTGNPFEEIFSPVGFSANSQILVVSYGAQRRALHLENFFGLRAAG